MFPDTFIADLIRSIWQGYYFNQRQKPPYKVYNYSLLPNSGFQAAVELWILISKSW